METVGRLALVESLNIAVRDIEAAHAVLDSYGVPDGDLVARVRELGAMTVDNAKGGE